MRSISRLSVVVCSILAFAGCSHGSAATRKTAELNLAPAVASNGLLVLYRNVGGFMGGGAMANATIRINEKSLGDIAQDTYALIEVPPGEQTVTFRGMTGESTVLVNVGASQVQYVQVTTYPSMTSGIRPRDVASRDLANDGEPLTLGLKHTVASAAVPPPANSTSM